MVNRSPPAKGTFDPTADQNGNSLAAIFVLKKTGRATMKKKISIVTGRYRNAPAWACIRAGASLLGMPLNLKFAIELREARCAGSGLRILYR